MDQHIALTKERIWRPLVSFITWSLKGVSINWFVSEGLGLTFLTSMGIIVEGVVADIIDEYRVNNKLTVVLRDELDKATWSAKKEFTIRFSLKSYRHISNLNL